MILQLPDDMGKLIPEPRESYAYLMQFADGNRIDLTVQTLASFQRETRDSQTILLLDKDAAIGPIPPASDRDYLPQPPTVKAFADCCNEFWWVAPYAAKGLWRQEILYAKSMLDEYLRKQLMKMLRWHIGLRTGFQVSPGKQGKYFRRYLEPDEWESLMQTYADADYARTWDALFAMCDLFRRVAVPLGEHYGFEYPFEDDRRVSAHLAHVRALPADAKGDLLIMSMRRARTWPVRARCATEAIS